MSCCPLPCERSSALVWLMCAKPLHVAAALRVLGEEARRSGAALAERFLRAEPARKCIKVLGRLLKSPDAWLSSTTVYIFGMLLENEAMVQKLQEWTCGDDSLCWTVGQLLSKEEPSVVLNAAGALASLVETQSGRQWLLQDLTVFNGALESVAFLLNQENESTVNSAALILARLSLCDEACQKLISHPSAPRTFSSLAQCLAHSHTDTAMNAAFTIGCLCGSEQGRKVVLAKAKECRLVNNLQALLLNGAGPEVGQTACFAMSCLASDDNGLALLMESSSFPALLSGLQSLLKSGDPDSSWFAAMTVKVLVSRPAGVIRVREHRSLEEQIECLSLSSSTGPELQKELSACLRKLRRLSKPSPITIKRLQSGAYIASWETLEPESGLKVTYNLFDGDTVLYSGSQCQFTLPTSHLRANWPLCLRLNLSSSDGDTSPFSDPVEMTVENINIRPGMPQKLCVIGSTATQVQLSWAEPNGEVKCKLFQVYCDDILMETTKELGTTVSCLSPCTTYTISVCALGPWDTAGPRSSIVVQTNEGHNHSPCGLMLTVLGRHKLHITWEAPAAPLGKLFSYELHLNSRMVYLGTERSHTARRLTANTSYTCTVTALTSRGRFQSRPVTKRTAKNEYMNTNRRSNITQPLLPPPVVQEVSELKTKARKSLSPSRLLPDVHLAIQHHTDPDLKKTSSTVMLDKLPSVSVQSHSIWKTKRNPLSQDQKCIGLFDQSDVSSMIPYGECYEHIRPEHQTISPPCLRPKISPAMLLQWGSGRTGSDSRKLPFNAESVRPLQPVSYNWPDLGTVHKTPKHHGNKPHRNRFAAGAGHSQREEMILCQTGCKR